MSCWCGLLQLIRNSDESSLVFFNFLNQDLNPYEVLCFSQGILRKAVNVKLAPVKQRIDIFLSLIEGTSKLQRSSAKYFLAIAEKTESVKSLTTYRFNTIGVIGGTVKIFLQKVFAKASTTLLIGDVEKQTFLHRLTY